MAKDKEFEHFTRIVLDEFKRVHERFDDIDGRLDDHDGRFASIESRFDSVDSRLVSMESRLSDIEAELRDIHRRLDTLEDAARNYAGFTKEIDHLLKRISAVEKHLGLQHNIAA